MPLYNPQTSGSGTIPEYTSDPVSPTVGQAWILRQGTPGSPIGLLLSLTQAEYIYSFSYYTAENTIIRVAMS